MLQGLIGSFALTDARPVIEAVPFDGENLDAGDVLRRNCFEGIGNLARLLGGQVRGRRADVSEALPDRLGVPRQCRLLEDFATCQQQCQGYECQRH